MNKILMPNCRFLAIESHLLGLDWNQCAQKIDLCLEELGLDLAEESIYFLFDHAPGSILSGQGLCQVARPIIGPLKEVAKPFEIRDWVQRSVYAKTLKCHDWPGLIEECYFEWENLHRQGVKIQAPFMILAKRRLVPELKLTLEVLFHE